MLYVLRQYNPQNGQPTVVNVNTYTMCQAIKDASEGSGADYQIEPASLEDIKAKIQEINTVIKMLEHHDPQCRAHDMVCLYLQLANLYESINVMNKREAA